MRGRSAICRSSKNNLLYKCLSIVRAHHPDMCPSLPCCYSSSSFSAFFFFFFFFFSFYFIFFFFFSSPLVSQYGKFASIWRVGPRHRYGQACAICQHKCTFLLFLVYPFIGGYSSSARSPHMDTCSTLCTHLHPATFCAGASELLRPYVSTNVCVGLLMRLHTSLCTSFLCA